MARKAASPRYLKLLTLIVLLGISAFVVAQLNLAPKHEQRITTSGESL